MFNTSDCYILIDSAQFPKKGIFLPFYVIFPVPVSALFSSFIVEISRKEQRDPVL
jgi:hypothetical protein